MEITTLLADPEAIGLEKIVPNKSSLTLVVRTTRTQAKCPRCHRPSAHVHSYYTRIVADLPWLRLGLSLNLLTGGRVGVVRGVADAVFEDGLHSLDVVDVRRPVTGKDHQIRSLSGRYGNERRESVKSPVQRRLRAPMSSAAGALRSSTVQQRAIPDT